MIIYFAIMFDVTYIGSRAKKRQHDMTVSERGAALNFGEPCY